MSRVDAITRYGYDRLDELNQKTSFERTVWFAKNIASGGSLVKAFAGGFMYARLQGY